LEDRLYETNVSRTGHENAALLGFVAEAVGELVGAVAGYTWGGICELRQVWVRETCRGKGLGKALMAEAIREAKARGCAYIYLATYDFQAPGFYAKLGFEKVAEIPDKPLAHRICDAPAAAVRWREVKKFHSCEWPRLGGFYRIVSTRSRIRISGYDRPWPSVDE